MNSQEIVGYVMNTPNNTNPVILKQMIDENSGGATSWNDLKDRPFYEYTTCNKIYNGTFAYPDNDGKSGIEVNGSYYFDIGFSTIGFEDESEGTSYIIKFDGVEYPCKRVGTLKKQYSSTNYSYAIGNTSLLVDVDEYPHREIGAGTGDMPLVDTGEPFVIWVQDYYDQTTYIFFKEPGEHTIEVHEYAVRIVTIDKKYLQNDWILFATPEIKDGKLHINGVGLGTKNDGTMLWLLLEDDYQAPSENDYGLCLVEDGLYYNVDTLDYEPVYTSETPLKYGLHLFVSYEGNWYLVV